MVHYRFLCSIINKTPPTVTLPLGWHHHLAHLPYHIYLRPETYTQVQHPTSDELRTYYQDPRQLQAT